MTKIIFSVLLVFSSLATWAQSTSPQSTSVRVTSGQVLRIEAGENQASVKIKGQQKLYIIPQLTKFSATKLNQLHESKESGKEVKLKVDSSNQILDIE